MKKRFLDRFTYPYLEKKVPENIVPGRVLSNKRIKLLLKSKTLKTSITSLSSSIGWGRGMGKGPHTTASSQRTLAGNKISNRSPGLWLRLIKGTLRLHKSKLGGESTPWLKIDTLERGSLASAVDSSLGIKLGDGGPALCGPRSSKVWVKTLSDEKAPALSLGEPKDTVRTSQLRGTVPFAEGHASLYSSIQLEEALTRQQERRPSPLLLKLLERNKLRIMYGNMANREVDKLIKRGFSARGGMNDNLFKLLESRIDVFLCRVGFLATIPCARQWIHYGKVLINQKITTSASHMLKAGDIISISTSNLAPLRESLQERSCKLSLSNRVEPGVSLPSQDLSRFRRSGKAKQGGVQLPNDFSKFVRSASHNNATRVSPYKPAEIARRVSHVARRERLRWFNLKPTYAEISFRCLTAIYLYPPQQVLLPAMVDVEKISKY
ncbi:Ribosomal protein S4 (mitochondrion) [Coccomyxa sp. Obi]|nr:Ribosomal protein S4 [Coccomyxa sp. Obi]